jgi:hypothetical protein
MSLKEAVLLQYKMAKNEEYVYEIVVDSNREAKTNEGNQQEHDLLKMRMTQKITAVHPDGSYSLEMLVEPKQLVRNGQEIRVDPMQQRVNMRMSKSGELLETSLQGPATNPSFPTRPVFVGETWEGESKVNLQDPATGQPLPPVGLKFNYTFQGIEKMKGYDCAKIIVKNPETEIPLSPGIVQKITANGSNYFAHKEGRLVKSEVETRIVMTHPEITLYNNIRITVDLVQAPQGFSSNEEFLISG